jgi:hypothetical protein
MMAPNLIYGNYKVAREIAANGLQQVEILKPNKQ